MNVNDALKLIAARELHNSTHYRKEEDDSFSFLTEETAGFKSIPEIFKYKTSSDKPVELIGPYYTDETQCIVLYTKEASLGIVKRDNLTPVPNEEILYTPTELACKFLVKGEDWILIANNSHTFEGDHAEGWKWKHSIHDKGEGNSLIKS